MRIEESDEDQVGSCARGMVLLRQPTSVQLIWKAHHCQVEYEETKARFDTLCEKASQIYKAELHQLHLNMCRDIHQRFERLCSLNPGRPSLRHRFMKSVQNNECNLDCPSSIQNTPGHEQGQKMVCCVLQYQETRSAVNWLSCKKIWTGQRAEGW